MPKKKKEVVIPNWYNFGARSVSIEFHKANDEGEYQACLTIFLDDGEEVEHEDDQKVVSVFLDFFTKDPLSSALGIAVTIGNLFDNIHDDVFVFNDEEIEKQFQLSVINKGAETTTKRVGNVTFH